MTRSNEPLSINARSIEILDDVAERMYTQFKIIDDSVSDNLNYDKISAKVSTAMATVKSLTTKAHLSNAGQRVIENKPKQMK